MPKPAGHEEIDVDAVLAGYDGWLTRQPLAARTREAYLAQVRDFVTWLAGSEHGARALGDPDVRDWAVRDYKRYVKTFKRWGPASVNQALVAIDNFYRSRGAGRPESRAKSSRRPRRARSPSPSSARSCGSCRLARRLVTGRS